MRNAAMNDKSMAGGDRVPEEAPAGPADSEANRADTPFTDDWLLFFEDSNIRNELGEAQSAPDAARRLSARHWSRLLYDPHAPWRGNSPYPRPNGASGGR